MRYLIDSSGWLEFFVGTPKAKKYRKYLLSKGIITPTLILYEVYKKIKRERNSSEAILAITQIQNSSLEIINLDESLALYAADLSLQYHLAMADAIIYATAMETKSILVTSDQHFKDLKEVISI